MRGIVMSQPKWYFEDFEVGKTIELGSRSVTEDEIIEFARQFDPQSFHVDKDIASKSIYGSIIASGWHTCGLIMRAIVDGYMSDAASMGSPGVDEIRWLKPVRGGDTLTVTATILDARASTSKPDRGVVTTIWHAKNQHGELVATIKGMAMFLRRVK
jgi:acyl dehydratase